MDNPAPERHRATGAVQGPAMNAFTYPVDGALTPTDCEPFAQASADLCDGPVLCHYGRLTTVAYLRRYYVRLYADLGLPSPTFQGGTPQ
jgi:hypothetical protein